MLAMEAVPDAEFEPGVLACLPATPWAISGDEIARRRDLRSTRCARTLPLRTRHPCCMRMHVQ
jgi:DIS3-like exonuclease 2